MRHLFTTILAAGICLLTFTAYGQTPSMQGMSLELEDAFLDKPKVIKEQRGGVPQVPVRTMPDGTGTKEGVFTDGEKWQARLETVLDIPKAPLPKGIELDMLKAPGSKFLVAVYDSEEEDVVRKTRQIIWSRARMLFTGAVIPLVHVMPVSGGTFSAGRTFFTIMNEADGFAVFYKPHGSARKGSLTFSGGEGAFLTPEGFVCRIRRYVPDTEGNE